MTAKGWHSRGYLPHFDSPETIQFLTFRLADSLPREAIDALRATPTLSDSERDALLDAGAGACWLRRPEIARIAEDALLHFDGQRYRLFAWTIMPNHVHARIAPQHGFRLGEIVSSWKRFTARAANRELCRSGAFWQDDYWDTYIRNERHFESTIAYIENNAVKAGLAARPSDWPWSHTRRCEG
ncbi:REP element-mobilizing transposase RayT [Enhydrobacter aerosaccus]|uniref:REP element-mobilizing transposase RayT n=1 Tax=Enhydrobacter aerosaccus TaxID=225324 RepID=A0A1T4P0C3_9HYPH|nr:transposase [Enhydrobacter aerosaccus]SJZ84889.1 REP element-mobilizing transposase RayT [Enhydrobacter aerosaccus]